MEVLLPTGLKRRPVSKPLQPYTAAAEIRPLGDPVRPIHSGVLYRRGERLPESGIRLLEFTRRWFR